MASPRTDAAELARARLRAAVRELYNLAGADAVLREYGATVGDLVATWGFDPERAIQIVAESIRG